MKKDTEKLNDSQKKLSWRKYTFAAVLALIFLTTCLCRGEYDVFCIGSSYTIDHGYIQSMADSAGIELKAGTSDIFGEMKNIWERSRAVQNSSGNPAYELTQGTVHVLLMTATRPFRYTEVEAEACANFSRILIEKNPDAQIYIHDYWTVTPPERSLYPEIHGWDNVRGMHLGSIKLISLMAHKLNHKVYVIPMAMGVQSLREKIIAGEFENYKDNGDLMSDSIHLSEMGRYVQSCMAFCAAYKYDVRKLSPESVNRSVYKLKFSTNDSKIIHELIYETVRNTPYSGWYKNESESTQEYLRHLENGLKNWESFDKLYPHSGTGTFKGDNDIEWSYTNIRSGKDGETLTEAFIILDRDSTLSATIQGVIRDLHFAIYRGAEIEVLVDGKSMGIFKPVRAEGGWNNHYFKIKDINRSGDVKVEFIGRKNDSIMDNISWTTPDF
jgi:hypothetical protein